MEQARKHLKTSSFVVLVFVVFSLLNIATELFFGEFNNALIPDGAPENILQITKIFAFVVSFILLLPQIYIGVKGLRIAKKPNASKGHIVWASILFVFALLGLIDPILNLLNQGSVYENISALLSVLIEVIVFFEYIKYAKAVANSCK